MTNPLTRLIRDVVWQDHVQQITDAEVADRLMDIWTALSMNFEPTAIVISSAIDRLQRTGAGPAPDPPEEDRT